METEKKLNEELDCEHIRKQMIGKIQKMDCETLLSLKTSCDIDIENLSFRPLRTDDGPSLRFNHPIPTYSKNGQVAGANIHFPLFTAQFNIYQICTTIDLYRKNKNYMFIYFLYQNFTVNIAFLFKNDEYKGEDFIINSSTEKLYVLKNMKLIEQTKAADIADVKKFITNYQEFFNTNYSCYQFTKYIIFDMKNINLNFKNFDITTEIHVGALPYLYTIRPNLILKINKNLVLTENPHEDDNGSYYYNIGHMYP